MTGKDGQVRSKEDGETGKEMREVQRGQRKSNQVQKLLRGGEWSLKSMRRMRRRRNVQKEEAAQ